MGSDKTISAIGWRGFSLANRGWGEWLFENSETTNSETTNSEACEGKDLQDIRRLRLRRTLGERRLHDVEADDFPFSCGGRINFQNDVLFR